MEATDSHMFMERKTGRRAPEWTADDEASLGAERQAVVDRAKHLVETTQGDRNVALMPSYYLRSVSSKEEGQYLVATYPADDMVQKKYTEGILGNPLVTETVLIEVRRDHKEQCQIRTFFSVIDADTGEPTIEQPLKRVGFYETTHLDGQKFAIDEALQCERIATYGWLRIFDGMNATLDRVEALVAQVRVANVTAQPDSVR